LVIGAAFVAVGLLSEVVGASYFRGFFDMRHGRNEKLGWKDDAWVKRLLARAGLVLGVVLVLVRLALG
jgi:hypothetical protein